MKQKSTEIDPMEILDEFGLFTYHEYLVGNMELNINQDESMDKHNINILNQLKGND